MLSKLKQIHLRWTDQKFEDSSENISPSALSGTVVSNVKYVSFEEALKKVYEKNGDKKVDEEAKEDFEKVMKICKDRLQIVRKLDKSTKLTDDQIMALVSYTIGENSGFEPNNPPYRTVNRVLGTRNTNGTYACREYIFHLLSAMRAYGTCGNKKALYRAIAVDKFDESTYGVGSIRSWPGFTSTTTNKGTVDNFLLDDKINIMFVITGDYIGYSMKMFSTYFEEEEVILEPETVFTIKNISIVKRETSNNKPVEVKRIEVVVENSKLLIEEEVKKFTLQGDPTLQLSPSQPPQQQQCQFIQQQWPQSQFQCPHPQSPPQQQQCQFIQQQWPQSHFQCPHPQSPPQQQQKPPLPEGWTEEYNPCTGMPYYHNKKTGQFQMERPKMPVARPQVELPLCSYPFTCHRMDDMVHLKTYRHACKYDRDDCPHINDPQHTEMFFHLFKNVCTINNCQQLKDPQHRFEFYHKGMPAFMTMCRERALCNCVDAANESHLREKFHTDTGFEYPKNFSYN